MRDYIKENVSLAELTTFAIGGSAAYLACPSNLEELLYCLDFAREKHLPIYPIGQGSNILASDKGFDGLLIKPKIIGITVEKESVKAGAGCIWDDLVQYTVEHDLAGLECLSGIPGQVGAAPVQNIGAYGQEVANVIDTVEVLSLADRQLRQLSNEECCFKYRSSNFKTEWAGRYIITAVTFNLKASGAAVMRYQDLQRFFAQRLEDSPHWQPSLQEVRQAVLAVRRSKSMTYDLANPNHRCAGSFYLNPIIPQAQGEALQARYPQIPVYPVPQPGFCKISAAWLVDNAGFHKGYRWGLAGISTDHALALINPEGKAKAKDILALSHQIVEKVEEIFGIILVPEPNLLGDFDGI